MFAKPQIKWEQMINIAHKLTSLQAYNFLQVDNKDRSFRTVVCFVQTCDAFGCRFFFSLFAYLLQIGSLFSYTGEKKLYTAEEIMFRKI